MAPSFKDNRSAELIIDSFCCFFTEIYLSKKYQIIYTIWEGRKKNIEATKSFF